MIGKMLRRILLGKGIPKRNDQTQIRLGHLANYLCLILTPKKDAYGTPPPTQDLDWTFDENSNY
jgi:hypothetical protein